MLITSRCEALRIDARTAQMSSPISSPANGSTGQNPCTAKKVAIANVVPPKVAMNARALRGVSERCGASSKRHTAGSDPGTESGCASDATPSFMHVTDACPASLPGKGGNAIGDANSGATRKLRTAKDFSKALTAVMTAFQRPYPTSPNASYGSCGSDPMGSNQCFGGVDPRRRIDNKNFPGIGYSLILATAPCVFT